MIALSENLSVALIAVLGTTIPALLGLLGIYVQNRRLSNVQRDDHANTAKKVDDLVVGQREIKADIRDVKDEVRSHGDRLRSLEHWNVTQDETTAIVQSNARKLSSINKENKPHAS
jgi:low affinity Fe/Cu permease